MNSYWRVVRLALRLRGRYAVAIVCACIGAAFWGGNLGAIYPTMKVLLHSKTLQEAVDEQVARQSDRCRKIEERIASLEASDTIPKREQGESATPLAVPRGEAQPSAEMADDSLAGLPVELLKFRLAEAQVRLKWCERLSRWTHRFVPSDRYKTLILIQLTLFIGLLLNSAFEFVNEVLVASITEKTMLKLRNQFYHQVMRMEMARFTQQGTSELMARFTSDMKGVANGVEVLLGTVIREPLKAIACISLACWVNWRLTLLAIAVVPIAAALIVVIGTTMRRAARRCLESMSSIYQILQESFQGIKIVKAFAMESYERLRFLKETRSYYRKAMRNARLDAITSPVIGIVAVAAVMGTIVVGSYLVINKETRIVGIPMTDQIINPETLLLLYVFLAGVSDPMRKLSNVFARIQRAAAAADRIYAFMDQPATSTVRLGAPRLARHRESVEFAGVDFSYTDSRPVLRDVELRVAFGETIALVGPNGCGKSTLVSLLPRFYDPTRGQIRIDGVDIREVQRRSLRQQLGVVTQETILFNDTVYNNIAYGNRRASRDEVIAASKRAYAHQFIVELPAGYDTIVGERALKLSGGQRQRIALARAILRDPAILILDEATSALDVESESLIQAALEEFKRGRTTILITHRLASLQLADRIVVMNAGRIEAEGKHEELLARCPLYARLHEIHENSMGDGVVSVAGSSSPNEAIAPPHDPWTQLAFSFYRLDLSRSPARATQSLASSDSISAAA
jgi:ABC-type multidrug transport system fused ATPase/permease subunit